MSAQMADPDLVNRIHYELTEPRATFGPVNDEEQVSVAEVGGPEAGSRLTFVTWTEGSDAPYYCIEPWMAPPNAPENRKSPSAAKGFERRKRRLWIFSSRIAWAAQFLNFPIVRFSKRTPTTGAASVPLARMSSVGPAAMMPVGAELLVLVARCTCPATRSK